LTQTISAYRIVKDIVKGDECATRIVGKHIRETGSAAESPVYARQSHFHTGAAALKLSRS
jgi:hypothetical protein